MNPNQPPQFQPPAQWYMGPPQALPARQNKMAKLTMIWLLVVGLCLAVGGFLGLVSTGNFFQGILWGSVMVIGAVAIVGSVVIKGVTDAR